MLEPTAIIGQRILRVFVDYSLSDDFGNHAVFVCELVNGATFQLPAKDDAGLHFDVVSIVPVHFPVPIATSKWRRLQYRLWQLKVADILVDTNPELHFPNSARITLTNGKFVIHMSFGPIGILPIIDVCDNMHSDETMVSVWSLRHKTSG